MSDRDDAVMNSWLAARVCWRQVMASLDANASLSSGKTDQPPSTNALIEIVKTAKNPATFSHGKTND